MRAQTDLDSFDRKILDCLQTDARAPLHKIGEAVHLSTAAVQRRVKRLEGAGVIDAVVAVLDPAKLGRRTTIIVEVTLESERNDRLDIIRRKFLACPQVQQCYYVTGDSDFVLILTVGSMEEYDDIAQLLFHDDDNIRKFRTIVSMKRIKSSFRIPVMEE
jgi:DNA-binding Lrp family transcriptional regulator